MTKPALFIRTFGCQMNETDSERIAAQFAEHGYTSVNRPEDADVVLLNSCSVRERAEQKLYSALGRLLVMKKHTPSLQVGVCGCTVQKDAANLRKRFPDVDFWFGTFDVHNAYALFQRHNRRTADKPYADMGARRVYPRRYRHKAFVTIMEGCNNFCTYCIIPFVRGRERCRPLPVICGEIEHLVAQGVKEVTLLGQNVNSYAFSGHTFASLLAHAAAIKGLRRLRFVTSHPRDLTVEVMDVMAAHDTICPSLHLPVQSGSDRILQAMNRGYTRADYLEIVHQLRRRIPDMYLSSDIIVGFPGETEADFAATMELVRQARFGSLFSFRYCHRPPARSATMAGAVPEAEKYQRLYRLQALQREISLHVHGRFVGTEQEVLIDGINPKANGQISGKNRHNITVNIPCVSLPAADPAGNLLRVRVLRACTNSLLAEMAE